MTLLSGQDLDCRSREEVNWTICAPAHLHRKLRARARSLVRCTAIAAIAIFLNMEVRDYD